ncbi:MAG: dihydropteroate synthase [Blautia sp.]|jgi:5-methyltetrahydrofolate corrinoid/iron sulfur protein methyltransferase|uniref:dihydropteroate synthase n=1 Tax=Blautia sp. TaxID=1955243 RepID=UPI003D8C9CF1
MIIIGEKINGSIPGIKQYITTQNNRRIRELAIRQTEAGADYLDICAGTASAHEAGTLKWLIAQVQDAVDTPLCIDSPDAEVLEKMLTLTKKPGLLNSAALEKGKCDLLFPLISDTQWQIIVQTTDDDGVPEDAENRIKIADAILDKAARYSVKPEQIHIDPLLTAISANNQSMVVFTEAVRGIRKLSPKLKITAAISNLSFGMPLRQVINQHFYAVAAFLGLDSAILDPCSRELYTSRLVMDALLGKDRLCRRFTNAYRKGMTGRKKPDC